MPIEPTVRLTSLPIAGLGYKVVSFEPSKPVMRHYSRAGFRLAPYGSHIHVDTFFFEPVASLAKVAPKKRALCFGVGAVHTGSPLDSVGRRLNIHPKESKVKICIILKAALACLGIFVG
jgi:hypothetical protein